jgi:hypothetical protein
MTFNINEFKAQTAVNGGFLKNNRYAVLISKPNILPSTFTDLTALRFYAETATIPGIALQTAELRRQGIGNLEKTPWGAAFTDITISFRIDQKTKVWNFFQVWMNKIYNFNMDSEGGRAGTLFEMNYKDDYSTAMSLFVYNEIGSGKEPVITIDFVDIFPVSISDMQMNWGGADIMKLNVNFNFRSWHLRPSSSYPLDLNQSSASQFLRQKRTSDLTVDPTNQTSVNTQQPTSVTAPVNY